MMAAPASALELGKLRISSSLGEPLRASISYALSRHEELYDFCVYLRPGLAANGLPALSTASISIADGMILFTGSRAIREPLLTMQVSIDCPYTAHISREYTLMLNPPITAMVAEGPIIVEPRAATEAARVTPALPDPAVMESPAAMLAPREPKPRPPVPSRRAVVRMPIAENSRYLVLRGDSLSDIASRIANRSIPLWPAVDRIFEANSEAFMAGDMNRLKAGSWLHIPDLSSAAPEPMISAAPEPMISVAPALMIAETVLTEASAAANESADFGAYTGYEPEAAEAEPPVIEDAVPAPVVTQEPEIEEPIFSKTSETESDLQPQRQDDSGLDGDGGFVTPIGVVLDETASIDIPDTEIIEPGLQQVPIVSTRQDDETAGTTSGSWSWFVWLGGTGLALILGLLLFGQRIKGRFGSVAVGAASRTQPDRRQIDVSAMAEEVEDDVVFEDLEASPQSTSLMLDADFGDGSGLQDGADMDVAQDFGFSATSIDEDLDMLIPEGADAELPDDGTEMIPPIRREASILESEVLPTDDDDYDMSVIVDVTKQDVLESDATEKDLQAVQIDAGSESMQNDPTLTQDADYKILEQDYEDEFTATRALNAEIEKAAAELAERMDLEAASEVIASLPENTSAVNDDIDDSSSNLELTAELLGPDDDTTAEISTTDEDITAGTELDSAEIEITQKKKAS